MADLTQLLNAMLGGGVRGNSPLSEMMNGRGGGHPMGGILGQVLGGLGGQSGGSGGGMARGGNANDILAQVAGAVLGGRMGSRMGGGGLGRMAGMAVLGMLAGKLFKQFTDRAAAPAGQAGTSGIPGIETVPSLGGHPAGDTMTASLPTEADADSPAARAKAALLIRAMVEAAKADGAIDADERQAILGKLAAAGCGDEERAYVERAMASPPDLDGLVAQVRDPQTAVEVFTASMLAISVDTDQERQYLKTLGQRLGLGDLSI